MRRTKRPTPIGFPNTSDRRWGPLKSDRKLEICWQKWMISSDSVVKMLDTINSSWFSVYGIRTYNHVNVSISISISIFEKIKNCRCGFLDLIVPMVGIGNGYYVFLSRTALSELNASDCIQLVGATECAFRWHQKLEIQAERFVCVSANLCDHLATTVTYLRWPVASTGHAVPDSECMLHYNRYVGSDVLRLAITSCFMLWILN